VTSSFSYEEEDGDDKTAVNSSVSRFEDEPEEKVPKSAPIAAPKRQEEDIWNFTSDAPQAGSKPNGAVATTGGDWDSWDDWNDKK